jgi:AcrR family transcriptional regulator
MGRHRAFDVDDALDRAMKVFWRKGYEGASMADLTAAMKVNSPSIYAVFGSKEGLFNAVLDRYDTRRIDQLAEILADPDARRVATRYLHSLVDYATDKTHPPGCLLVQAGLSCGEADVPKQLAKHRATTEQALRKRFVRAKKEKDLPAGCAPATMARYVMAIANGVCVQASEGAARADLNKIVAFALASWPASKRSLKTSRR